MRVAILTLPLITNYGGILQAYALQTILERMGHEVKVLQPPPYKAHSNIVMPLVFAKRIIQKYFFRKDISVKYDGHTRTRLFTDQFIRKYIHGLVVSDWDKLYNCFDCYIVGSDQIWRPKYTSYFWDIRRSYLDFTHGWEVKRIAYAASFGTDQWEYDDEQTKDCKRFVEVFNSVSVREKSGVLLCEKYLQIKANHVLDPTLLLAKRDYDKLIDNSIMDTSCGSLMSYILDNTPEKREYIQILAAKYHLIPFDTNMVTEQIDSASVFHPQPPVEQWLRSFRDSSFVVTDSFHACVFSIIYHKQFVVFLNAERGNSRIVSLLKTFGLENRVVTSVDYLPKGNINYNDVDMKLSKMYETSMRFLKESLI